MNVLVEELRYVQESKFKMKISLSADNITRSSIVGQVIAFLGSYIWRGKKSYLSKILSSMKLTTHEQDERVEHEVRNRNNLQSR